MRSRSEPDESGVASDEDITPVDGVTMPEGGAVERMMPLVYEELRRIARRQLRHEGVGHTLNTTALVHEAYLRLAAPSHSM